jgi:hypothetical protein
MSVASYHSPVLICGYYKSGTTLLLSLLTGHPELVAFPLETCFLRAIARKKRRQTAEYGFQNLRWVRQICEEKVLGEFCDSEHFARRMRELLDGSLPTRYVLSAYVLAYAEATNQAFKERWVEKTPENELHLESALRLWPDLKTIRMVRDPRDSFASYRIKRRRGNADLTMTEFLRAWKKGQSCWDRFARRRPQKCLQIQFEHLASNAEVVMRQVSAFLEIEFDDVLLQPMFGGRAWSGNSMHDEDFTAVSSRPIGRYSQVLGGEEIAVIERALADSFLRFGWPRETVPQKRGFLRRAA